MLAFLAHAMLRARSVHDSACSGSTANKGELIRLLQKDGRTADRRTPHGLRLYKVLGDGRKHFTVVPTKRSHVPDGTLAAILGPKQTQIGRDGLVALIDQYGIRWAGAFAPDAATRQYRWRGAWLRLSRCD